MSPDWSQIGNEKIIMYTGHLYDWKGTQVLANSAKYLPENYLIVFIGGTQHDVKKFKEKNADLIKSNKIFVLGYKAPQEISDYLNSADVLVLPNSAKDKKSRWTSPLKMFEYMASEKPILASDLPSIREVLNENNAVFFKPDDPQDLADKIKYILDNFDLAEKISTQAKIDVQNYTWDKRAEKIINFIK
jgi:glycosyltransferase involved in cell wall biosynthesis